MISQVINICIYIYIYVYYIYIMIMARREGKIRRYVGNNVKFTDGMCGRVRSIQSNCRPRGTDRKI